MAKYTVAVTRVTDRASTVRLLRGVSSMGIADITNRLGTSEPVVELDTWEFPLGMGNDRGVPYQQQRILALLAKLHECGATVVVNHHAGTITETVSIDMLRNLFESELQDLAQEHD